MNKLLPYLFKAQSGVQTEWWMNKPSDVFQKASLELFAAAEKEQLMKKWLNKYNNSISKAQFGAETLAKKKTVGELKTPLRNLNTRPVLPMKSGDDPIEEMIYDPSCPDPTGLGCSYQATREAQKITGLPLQSYAPADAGYREAVAKRSGLQEIFQQIDPRQIKNANSKGYGWTYPTEDDFSKWKAGDIVTLDAGIDIFSYDPPKGYTKKDNAGNSHVGVIVGFNEQGRPIIKHGLAKGKGKGKSYTEVLGDDNRVSSLGHGRYAIKSVIRPKEIDKDGNLTASLPVIESAEEIAKRKLKTNQPVEFYLKDTPEEQFARNLPVAANISYTDDKRLSTKKNLLSFFNDEQLDGELKYKLGITSTELNNLKPVVYGIAGQESGFNDPNPAGQFKDFIGGMFAPKNTSRGLFQVKYNSLTKQEREVLDIKSPKDLLDDRKAYQATILLLKNAKARVDKEVEEGTHPELADKDPYFRAAYYYNAPGRAITDAKTFAENKNKRLKNKIGWANDVTPEQAELRMDKGSYPYKLMQKAKDLGVDYDFETPTELEEVVIYGNPKDKNKKFVKRNELQNKKHGGWLDEYDQLPQAHNGIDIPWWMKRPAGDISTRVVNPAVTLLAQQAKERSFQNARMRSQIGPDNRSAQQKIKDRQAFLQRKKYEEEVLGRDFTMPTSLQERNREQAERIIHNLIDAPMTLMGAGELAYGVGKFTARQLPKVGEYLTTQTPLKNTWQLNPFANKLGQYNRVVGQDAVLDLQQSGLIRSGKGAPTTMGTISVNRPTRYPSFAKGAPGQTYINQVQEAGQTPFIISTDRSMGVSTLGRHGKGTTQFPIDESGNYLTSFPASEAKVYEAAPHWLKGYKEVPKPTSSQQITRGFIDWGDAVDKSANPYFNPRKYENWVKPKTDFSVPFDPNMRIIERRKGGPVVDPRGQWAHPGKHTIVPTPTGQITMQGVPYPVYGLDETGYGQMMMPGGEYEFPGQMVYEIPMMQKGGLLPKYQTRGQVGRAPIYVNNPRDPRLRAYQDSLNLYNYSKIQQKLTGIVDIKPYDNELFSNEEYNKRKAEIGKREWKNNARKEDYILKNIGNKIISQTNGSYWGNAYTSPDLLNKNIKPTHQYQEDPNANGNIHKPINFIYKKPVQQVVYRKPVSSTPVDDDLDYMLTEEGYDKNNKYYKKITRVNKKPKSSTQPVQQQPSVPQPQFPAYRMKGNTPVYGPTNSLIGMLDSSTGEFYPDYENTAARASVNQADANMLQNMQLIQEYLKSKGVVNPKILPKQKKGGQHGGLDRWFAEKWVDVKTGKACGRQEGEDRAYPACRPSRRVSFETPKTSSEMSPAEKAKFKRSKTSSERINYNHKRK